MSTQFEVAEGHVSVACGRPGMIRLDVVDQAGQHAFVFLTPDDAARIGRELLRRSAAPSVAPRCRCGSAMELAPSATERAAVSSKRWSLSWVCRCGASVTETFPSRAEADL